MCRDTFFFGHLTRSLHAIHGRESNLLLLSIFARGLAKSLRRLLHVQHVVDNLKRQAGMFAEVRKRTQLLVVAAGIDAAHPQAGL
jgi:hypothetical protein